MTAISISHKIALEPTKLQAAHFALCVGASRKAYNWALDTWNRQWDDGRKPKAADIRKLFNEVKWHDDTLRWMTGARNFVADRSIQNLGEAWKKHFRAPAQWRKPTFHSTRIHRSFYVSIGNRKAPNIQVQGRRVRLCLEGTNYPEGQARIGWVKMREELRWNGRIESATISRDEKRWYISFSCSGVENYPHRAGEGLLGVSIGFDTVALSNGTVFDQRRPLERYLVKKQRLSRSLSRKQSRLWNKKTKEVQRQSSANWEKARARLARLDDRIANLRSDFIHRVTTDIVRTGKALVIEAVNVQRLLKDGRTARAASDVSFFEWKRQLQYKTQVAGGSLQQVPTSIDLYQVCSRCGRRNYDARKYGKRFVCPHCGLDIENGVNIASNLATVKSAESQACG